MPRLLPWQSGNTAKPQNTTPTLSSTRRRKEPTLSEEEDTLLDDDLNPLRQPSIASKGKRPVRDASSSPPPISSAPAVEHMRVGEYEDDQWMMVEDEFYTTAKIYTQHIHHAEYIRKTEEAKDRQARGDSGHFTDDITQQSRATQFSLVAEAKERMIKAAVEARDEDDSDMDVADPHLAGLMTASGAPTLDLTSFARLQTNTRAAAGFQQSPRRGQRSFNAVVPGFVAEETDASTEDDDDDLDRPLRRRDTSTRVLTISPKKERLSGVSRNTTHNKPSITTDSPSVFAQFRGKQNSESKPSVLAEKHTNMQDSPTPSKSGPTVKEQPPVQLDLDSIIKAETPTYHRGSSYLARKRAEREKRRKEEEEKAAQAKIKTEYEIPTFL